MPSAAVRAAGLMRRYGVSEIRRGYAAWKETQERVKHAQAVGFLGCDSASGKDRTVIVHAPCEALIDQGRRIGSDPVGYRCSRDAAWVTTYDGVIRHVCQACHEMQLTEPDRVTFGPPAGDMRKVFEEIRQQIMRSTGGLVQPRTYSPEAMAQIADKAVGAPVIDRTGPEPRVVGTVTETWAGPKGECMAKVAIDPLARPLTLGDLFMQQGNVFPAGEAVAPEDQALATPLPEVAPGYCPLCGGSGSHRIGCPEKEQSCK